MKKKILVCSHWLELGGAERALIGLLDVLAASGHEIDLYLCRHTGEFMPHIPEGVRLLPEDPAASSIAVGIKEVLKRRAFGIILGRLVAKNRTGRYCRIRGVADTNVGIEYSHRYTWRFVQPINPETEYDLVLSFLAPHYIAAFRTRGKQKIAWIHTDYKAIDVDAETERNIWSRFDRIAPVSQQCAESFAEKFPSLADRLMVIENILPTQMVRKQATQDVNAEMPNDGSIRLLSVGRYCTAKNFDNVPDICARMVATGLNIKWYIIGFGCDEALIHQKIDETGMQDRVILLGKKENPYPYINACDLYVQPSRYEGKCVTVREAQMLGKPVVITRYTTSASQLEEDVDGAIVPMDNEGCARGIAMLLRDPDRMHRFSEMCRSRDYSNSDEVQKIYQLLE